MQQSYGIKVAEGAVSLDFEGVQNRKVQTVEQLYKGLQYLMRKHDITIMNRERHGLSGLRYSHLAAAALL